jgi:formylglycine-generating enzyme required for sulfatase activity
VKDKVNNNVVRGGSWNGTCAGSLHKCRGGVTRAYSNKIIGLRLVVKKTK